jgi:autotransporter-associated beta strand protein
MGDVALAASDIWDGETDGVWATGSNWVGSGVPGTGDTATFSGLGNGYTIIDLGVGVTLSSLLFDTSSAAGYTIGAGTAGSQTLRLDNAGAVTINADVVNNQLINAALGLTNAANATATIANNSAALLTLAGGIVANVASGNGLLTVTGAGNTTVSQPITKPGAGSNALLKHGAGMLTLSAGSSWSGNAALGRVPATSAGFPLVAREGALFLNGGTHTVNGELVIGGVVADGGMGQNARVLVDNSTLNITGWLSVGRGNGTGGVSSELIASNAAVISSANFSAGYDGGNVANTPKGAIALNNTATLTVTGNGEFKIAESAGSDMTATLNNSSKIVAAGTGFKAIGQLGLGSLTLNDSSSVRFGNGFAYIGYRSGTGVLSMATGTFFANGGEVRVGGSDASGTAYNGMGTFTMTGGTAEMGALVIARGNNNQNTVSGSVTVSGGTLTCTNDMILGFAGNNNLGKLTINGGTVSVGTTAIKWMRVGQWDTSRGQVDILSGELKLNASSCIKMNGEGTIGANVINQSGGAVTFYSDNGVTVGGVGNLDLQRAGAAASVNTYHLDGGTLTVPQILSSATTGTRTFNFNGGTLRAAASSATFMNLGTGNARANVRDNGAIIDSNGKNITVAQALLQSNVSGDAGTGGLMKFGTGTLTLSAGNTYAGPTTVSNGTLLVSGSLANGSVVSVVSNAALIANGTVGGTVAVAAGATVGGAGTINNLVTLAPGNAAISLTNSASATLTLGGGLTLDDGNLLAFDVGATADKIAITGGVFTKNPGTVTVTVANIANFSVGTYDLITGANITSTNGFVLANAIEPFRLWLTASDGKLQLVVAAEWVTAWWKGDVDSVWNTYNAGNGNWDATQSGGTDVAGIPLANFNLHFSADSAANFDTTLGTNTIVNTLSFDTGTPVTISGADTLTVNAGIVNSAAAGANSISVSGLVLGGDQTWVNNSATPFKVTAPVSGLCALTKSGTGNLTMTAANTYSGPTTINEGTLQLGDGAVDGSVTSAISNNASLAYVVASAQTAPAPISGSGAVTKTGAGTLTMTAMNNYSGPTTISEGTLQLGNGTTAGSLAADCFITNSAVLAYNVPTDQSLKHTISGSGALTKTGTGKVALYGGNTYSGGTIVNGGVLSYDATGRTAEPNVTPFGTGIVTLNSGTALRLGETVGTYNNSLFTIANNIVLSNAAINALDGNLHLTGALLVGLNGGQLGSTYNSGNAAESNKGLIVDGIVSGSGDLTVRHTGYNTGNSWNASFVAFANAANTYSGTITVNPMSGVNGGSYLGINAGTALANATVNLNGNNTSTYKKFGDSTLVFNTGLGSALLGALIGSGNVVLTGYNEVTHAYGTDAIELMVGNNNASALYSGAMSGLGGVTKTGNGALTLTGAHTYSGVTKVQGGAILCPSPLKPALAYTFNTGTATNSGRLSVTTTLGATPPVFSPTNGPREGLGYATFAGGANSYIDIAAPSLPNFSSAATYTIAMWIKTTQAGAAYLYKGDLGWGANDQTFYLNEGNTTPGTKVGGVQWGGEWVTGATAVNDGTWKFISIVRSNSLATVYVNGVVDGTDNGMWNAEQGTQRIRIGWSPSDDGSAPFIGDISGTYIYDRALTAEQINALMTTGSDGTLYPSILPVTTAVQLAAGTALALDGIGQTVASLTGPADSGVSISNSVLTLSPASGSVVFDGTVFGNLGSIVKAGAGTQALNGGNPYTGATRVTAGTLAGICVATNSALVIAAGGTVAPGNGGVGAMEFADVTIETDGRLAFDLVSVAGSDKIITTGALSLNGLSFTNCAFSCTGHLPAGNYVLVDATSVSGSLGAEVEGLLPAAHTMARLMVDEEHGDLILKVASNGTLIRLR